MRPSRGMAAVCFPGNRLHAIARASLNPSRRQWRAAGCLCRRDRSRFIDRATKLSIEELSQEIDPQAGEGASVDEEYVEETLVNQGVIAETPGSNDLIPHATPDATLAASGYVVDESSTQHETHHSAQIHESEIRTATNQKVMRALHIMSIQCLQAAFGFSVLAERTRRTTRFPHRNLRNQLTPRSPIRQRSRLRRLSRREAV